MISGSYLGCLQDRVRSTERFEEGEEVVGGLVSAWWAGGWSCPVQGLLFEGEIGLEVDPGLHFSARFTGGSATGARCG